MTRRDGFLLLDLGPYFNNDAISRADNPGDGGFNVWGNSFPAASLPPGGAVVSVGQVPFRFPPSEDGQPNNVVCRGQLVPIPAGRYDWIYFLAAAERRTEDQVCLHYEDGAVDPEWLRVSDFWPGGPHFGEVCAYRCPDMHYPRHVQPGVQACMWRPRVPVTRATGLARLRLPDNEAIHLFAASLMLAWQGDDPPRGGEAR